VIKVVQVAFGFPPDSVGGTEVYVGSLSQRLVERGVEVAVAAPADRSSTYEHEGLRIRRFAVAKEVADLRELYGEGDEEAAGRFGQILDEEEPEVVHLHALTRGVSLRLVREAKQRRLRVAFTYHTPTVSCQRGTLLRWGRELCDGRLDRTRCAGCTLHGLGLRTVESRMLGAMPPFVGRMVGWTGVSGGSWTALRMPDLIQRRHAAVRALLAEVDAVVVLCQWAKDLLLRNGVPPSKITLSRHGLPQALPSPEHPQVDVAESPLRVAFLGRFEQVKGPDILVRALREMHGAPIQLDVYGVVRPGTSIGYARSVRELAGTDPRIRFLPAVASDRVTSLLRGYHLLAVPSRWLETGPLVVLEAFAAGTPVVGSNLGGIAELVRDSEDGILVECESIRAWQEVLGRLCEDRRALERLREGVQQPRGIDLVADEMMILYEGLLRQCAANYRPSRD
jgi:glycosyltransferase involved in cell wall biosynthesis